MKKAFAGVTGLVACLVCINGWGEAPLQLNYGTPQELGAYTLQPAKNGQSQINTAIQTSVFAQFEGSRLKSDEVDGHESLNGLGAGITFTALDTFNTTLGMHYQSNSDWNSTEIEVRGGYQFYNRNNSYANASIGIGYAWLKADDYDIRLRYVTLPLELEVGHYFQPRVAAYLGLGYKWLYIENLKDVCTGYFCDSGASDVLDLDGITYKTGIRYHF